MRGTATNHLMGDGWWAWMIALKGGDVSIGVVFDQRSVQWPEGGTVAQRLKDFLMQHPVAREIMADAQWTDGDVHWRKNLPYSSTTYAGDGFALVGDAAAFLDPFYSPGMDWISFTATSAAELILAQQRGEPMAGRVEKHNETFVRKGYLRWFQAIYQDKYDYMGDYQLMKLAFLMDLGLYYVGVAAQPFKRGSVGLTEPVYSTPPSTPFFYGMRAYNRRFAKIAQSRRARNCYGRMNDNHRCLIKGYTFSPTCLGPVLRSLLEWGWIELTEGWRTWFQKTRKHAADAWPMSPKSGEGDAIKKLQASNLQAPENKESVKVICRAAPCSHRWLKSGCRGSIRGCGNPKRSEDSRTSRRNPWRAGLPCRC